MSCRHGRILLTMVAGLAPLGCADWQPCWVRSACVMMNPAQPAAASAPANVSGELAPTQAAQLCVSAGEALEKKGYTAEAIAQYENARTHDPQARVARRLAVLYDLQGDPQHAEAEYTRAMQEQPGDAELLNDLGYFHYRHDRMEVAENWLRKAVEMNPGCACAWTNLGQVLARRGRLEESYAAFAKVLRPAEAYSNLGVLLAKQGRNAEARHMLQKAVSLDPTLKQPQAFLGALPPGPAPLPPGLTLQTPPVRESPANPNDMPTVLPARAPAASVAGSSRPAPLPPTPAVTPPVAPRAVTRTPPTPTLLPRTPAPLPTIAKPQPSTVAVPATPPPDPSGPALTPVNWAPPAPVKTTPAPKAKPKADDTELPVIINARPQPKPISTSTSAKVCIPSPPPPAPSAVIPAAAPAKVCIPSPPPPPALKLPSETPAPSAAPKVPHLEPVVYTQNAPDRTPAPSAAPKVPHLEPVPTAAAPVQKPVSPVVAPVKRPAPPRAVLIDCSIELEDTHP